MRIATLHEPDLHHFLPGIEAALRTKHEVARFEVTDATEIDKACSWADVVWCEFANNAAAYAARKCLKTVIRLHSYEAFSGLTARIPWDRVRALIHTSQHVLQMANTHQNQPIEERTKTYLIPSAVDMERFPLQPHKPANRIGVVAYLLPEKNLYAALQLMATLRGSSTKYTLDFAGAAAHKPTEIYLRHMISVLNLEDRVRLLGPVEDVAAFWADHDFCFSASVREGCPYNVLEAMACGVRPVIHNYWGASAQFPADLLWNTLDEARAQIQVSFPMNWQLPEASENLHYNPARYRALVDERYSIQAQTPELLRIVEAAGDSA